MPALLGYILLALRSRLGACGGRGDGDADAEDEDEDEAASFGPPASSCSLLVIPGIFVALLLRLSPSPSAAHFRAPSTFKRTTNLHARTSLSISFSGSPLETLSLFFSGVHSSSSCFTRPSCSSDAYESSEQRALQGRTLTEYNKHTVAHTE